MRSGSVPTAAAVTPQVVALDRVACGELVWRVHECVVAVLALESEPGGPRL